MDQPIAPASIQEKAPKPPGLLPKNVQSWILIGLAFLMVAIMWLTGGKKPPSPAKAAATVAPRQAPLEVNEAKIAELQNRIQDLQRQQLLAQTALAQQTRQLGQPERESAQAQQAPAVPSAEQRPPEDPIQAERKRRAYLSLFASNVALTYRKAPTNPTTPENVSAPASPHPDPFTLPQVPREPQPPMPPPGVARADSAESTSNRKEEPKSPAAVAANAAAGKTYVLFEGTILETVLINRLDGGFAGPVECMLSTDVYSSDRQHLLIPAGSKLLGETRKVDSFGQTRLAVGPPSAPSGAVPRTSRLRSATSNRIRSPMIRVSIPKSPSSTRSTPREC
jgi:type IV secretion system protein TrbI